MKKYKLFLLLIILICSGCSKNCKDNYTLDAIEIFNYYLQDTENIVIKGYKKDNNFQTLLDSFKIVKVRNIDSYGYDNYGYLNKKINTNYDYDIYFSDLDAHCKITGIKVKKEICSDGIFSRDYSHSFEEYYVFNTKFLCQVLKAEPYDYK